VAAGGSYKQRKAAINSAAFKTAAWLRIEGYGDEHGRVALDVPGGAG